MHKNLPRVTYTFTILVQASRWTLAFLSLSLCAAMKEGDSKNFCYNGDIIIHSITSAGACKPFIKKASILDSLQDPSPASDHANV